MACDGDIAKEEVDMVRELCSDHGLFEGLDIENHINKWISEINKNGQKFLSTYLNEVSGAELSTEEQLQLIDLAIRTIQADNKIEYSEVSFFKKIRFRLSVKDEDILDKHPEVEDYLLPDIDVQNEPVWDNIESFSEIHFNSIQQQ